MPTWKNLEDRVRGIATLIWGKPCEPGREAGVNVDAISLLAPDRRVYIEITEHDQLNKVRDDVVKLSLAKMAAMGKGIYVNCFCVVDGHITTSMQEAGREFAIPVLTVEQFQRMYFDFERYRLARMQLPFGSAVNPLTGVKDDSPYTHVSYVAEDLDKELSAREISKLLANGRHVVLVGEYGSGKSRCIREIFDLMTVTADSDALYPIAVNLRDIWGLKRAGEIIRRHYTDLGLEDIQSSAIRAAITNSLVFLLDGFDELGSQAWSSDDQRLRSIRVQALEGVRDTIAKSSRGVLICGREHYFSSDEEMLSSLGVDKLRATIIRVKTEFGEEEMETYFSQRGLDLTVPSWLPRRPLICRTVSDLPEADLERIFGVEGDEAAFWDHFLTVIATRDSHINALFDIDIVLAVLVNLARITRARTSNVGPIGLDDVQRAFESAVGKLPVEDASIMLQRLPGLGRVGPESTDRQFIDVAILDTLRARDVARLTRCKPEELDVALDDSWANGLGDLGQRVLYQSPSSSRGELLNLAKKASTRRNKTLAADAVATLTRGKGSTQSFESLELDDVTFAYLDLSERTVEGIIVKDSTISELRLPVGKAAGIKLEDCVVGHVLGVSSASGLPAWARVSADRFDSAQNVAQIRRLGLGPQHELLISILKKTFLQPGSGREEEALTRGFAQISNRSSASKILSLLERERFLTKFKGDSGWVYSPERSKTARVKQLIADLASSQDPIWGAVAEL